MPHENVRDSGQARMTEGCEANNLAMKQFSNETIKVSVIIITRNRAKLLKGCLDSLVKQTRLPNEVTVVDNASTDNTKKVILSFAKKLPIRYVLEKQIGTPYARNKGIKVARGQLLLMLDDDCEADKFWVERMAKAHKKYPKAWVVQGRTYSLPPTTIYSLLTEFDRFLYLKNSTRKRNPPLKMKIFFNKAIEDEVEILMCDTKNLSIKTSYLKKHKLSFDKDFCHMKGEDTDFGKQILQKKGLIMFCPSVMVSHWERSSLTEFLNQSWHIGRSIARIADKWKTPSFTANRLWQKPFVLLLFCKILNQWHNLPTLTALLCLDKVYRLNGYFYEKRILSHLRHSGKPC